MVQYIQQARGSTQPGLHKTSDDSFNKIKAPLAEKEKQLKTWAFIDTRSSTLMTELHVHHHNHEVGPGYLLTQGTYSRYLGMRRNLLTFCHIMYELQATRKL